VGTFLYPEEDAMLMGCPDIPLIRRIFFGLCIRNGLRRERAVSLSWEQVRRVGEHWVISIPGKPNKPPATFVLDPGTAEALVRWQRLVMAELPRTKLVFPAEMLSRSRSHREGLPMAIGNFATLVRDALLTAGVTRPAISKPLEGHSRLVGHDLRATFVTLARGAGLPDQHIAQRTGHTTTEMLNRYDHGSWLAKELGLGLPGRLCDLIPELAEMASEPESAESE